jgi:hypothetical protein
MEHTIIHAGPAVLGQRNPTAPQPQAPQSSQPNEDINKLVEPIAAPTK